VAGFFSAFGLTGQTRTKDHLAIVRLAPIGYIRLMSANANKPNRKRKFDTPRTPQENRKGFGIKNDQNQEAFRSEKDPVHLGKIIAGGRKSLGWSQKTFADNSEYDEKTIWNVENGNTEKPQTICDLRDVLNIALKKKGEETLPWPPLESTLELRESYENHPVIAASRLSSRGRNTSFEHLIGRDDERNALDFAWDGQATKWQRIFNRHANKESKLTGQPLTPRIVVFNAWAGIGKTSLVARWAADKLAKEKHSGITRYFDWSFYTQGTRREGDASGSSKTASAEPFLNKALERFGDSALAASNARAWQMAIRSAIMPLAQKPMPKSTMVSSVRPRSARYGCSRSSFSNRNFNGLLGSPFSCTGAGFAAGFGRGASPDFGASFPASPSEFTDISSGSR
jgi:transcriptional regulator with XRE-family HTH domain